DLAREQLLVIEALLVEVAAEWGFAETQRGEQVLVGLDGAIHVEQADRRVVANRGGIPQRDRGPVLLVRFLVLRLLEEPVALLIDRERVVLLVGRHVLRPRFVVGVRDTRE